MESPFLVTFYEVMQEAGYDPLRIDWEKVAGAATPPPPPPPR